MRVLTYETVKTACNEDFLDVHWDELMDAAWNTGCFIHAFYFTYEIRVWRCVIVYDSCFFVTLSKLSYKCAGL